jgi:hypothetical protein
MSAESSTRPPLLATTTYSSSKLIKSAAALRVISGAAADSGGDGDGFRAALRQVFVLDADHRLQSLAYQLDLRPHRAGKELLRADDVDSSESRTRMTNWAPCGSAAPGSGSGSY